MLKKTQTGKTCFTVFKSAAAQLVAGLKILDHVTLFIYTFLGYRKLSTFVKCSF